MILNLESDNIFEDILVKNWIEYNEVNEVMNRYNKLSSGHRIILMITACMVNLIEEKTLIIIDEPEAHLHPPLISAFIRMFANILNEKNGLGIVATHSPVIIQEIPKKCIWCMRRRGENVNISRPEIETFGENVSTLTREIFGYEVMESGYITLLKDIVERNDVDESLAFDDILKELNDELGGEGKMILRSLIHKKYRR